MSEINTLRSHLRIIHNIKDGPYLKLKCCINGNNCSAFFLSYSAFTKHMINCINKKIDNTERNSASACTEYQINDHTNFSHSQSAVSLTESKTEILKSVFSRQKISDINKIVPVSNNNHFNQNCVESNAQSLPNRSSNNNDSLLSDIVNLQLPETTTNKIFSIFTSFINSSADDLKNYVLSSELSNSSLCKPLIDKFNEMKNPFDNIKTTYLRNKKLQSVPGYVKAKRIVICNSFKPVLHETKLYIKKQKQVSFAYVPMLETLTLILRNEEVKTLLSIPHSHVINV